MLEKEREERREDRNRRLKFFDSVVSTHEEKYTKNGHHLITLRFKSFVIFLEFNQDWKIIRNTILFHQRKTFEPHDIETGEGDYLISRDKLMLLVDKNQVIRLQLEDYEMLDSDLGTAGFKFIHTSGPLDKFLLVDVKLASDLS